MLPSQIVAPRFSEHLRYRDHNVEEVMVLKTRDLGLSSYPESTLLILAANAVGVLCLFTGGAI